MYTNEDVIINYHKGIDFIVKLSFMQPDQLRALKTRFEAEMRRENAFDRKQTALIVVMINNQLEDWYEHEQTPNS